MTYENDHRITPQHLSRDAVIYVRQSTSDQVLLFTCLPPCPGGRVPAHLQGRERLPVQPEHGLGDIALDAVSADEVAPGAC